MDKEMVDIDTQVEIIKNFEREVIEDQTILAFYQEASAYDLTVILHDIVKRNGIENLDLLITALACCMDFEIQLTMKVYINGYSPEVLRLLNAYAAVGIHHEETGNYPDSFLLLRVLDPRSTDEGARRAYLEGRPVGKSNLIPAVAMEINGGKK